MSSLRKAVKIMKLPVSGMVLGAVLMAVAPAFAQGPAGPATATPDTQQAAPLLAPDQLDDLVAPVALYPDPLLGQVLAASTYPLEIVEAEQWLGQNRNLEGAQLMNAAKGQNWDPSVQALVAFPDALRLLANDVRWTTALGNAFLAQQTDVMSAVQRMRARAMANGRLRSTPQQTVTRDSQDGQNAIDIAPADPQVIYVPTYSPAYVWGPPVWDAYPDLWYPAGIGWGFGFGPGIFMNAFFPGWGGWGGWGWGCGWFGSGLFLNAGFFNHYGFHGGGFGHWGGFGGHGFGGRVPWTHDSGHRMGVPYTNRAVASRFGSTRFGSGGFGGGRTAGGQFAGGARGRGSAAGAAPGGWQHFGNGSRSPAAGAAYARGYARSAAPSRQASPNYGARGGGRSYQAPAQSNRGYGRGYGPVQGYRSSPSYGRSFSAPRSYAAPRGFSAPRSYAGPRYSGGGSHFSGGRSASSGGRSGFSGGHSGGGGGHAGGGGHHR